MLHLARLAVAVSLAALAAPAMAQVPPLRSTGGDPFDLSVEDARTLTGFGFTVSTSITAVSSSNYLYAALVNTGTGRLVMTDRVMSCNLAGNASPVEYLRYATGTALPAGTTPVTVGNRISGGAAIPATFSFGMGATPPTGTALSGGFVPVGGVEKRIKSIVVVPAGGSLVYSIGGSGGGLAASARCVMTFLGYVTP